MTTPLHIPSHVETAQKASSDPDANVWVSANAGSGKTHVLTERVIRLLLRGTKPARILCLTYTKAAAANMQSRIFNVLSQWITYDDASLTKALIKIEGVSPDTEKLSLARRLFAYALETPGGLKIQTIHAFCESILHQFPLEANIAGHFEMMDDAAQKEAITGIKKQFFTKIQLEPSSDLAKAFHLVLQKAGEAALHELLSAAINNKQYLSRYSADIYKKGITFFYDILGLGADFKKAQNSKIDIKTLLVNSIKLEASFSEAEYAKIADLGGKRAQDFITTLKKLMHQETDAAISTAFKAFTKTDGDFKDPVWLFGKKALTAWPEIEDIFLTKAATIQALKDKWNLANLAELNNAAYILINDLLDRYQKFKKAQGLLDFGDLIDRTLALLKRGGAGLWVQYRLDQGIDHILVDEAQDTSPEQWQIIRLLSQDFFTGLGAREDLERTIFAVGDEKQSIYSFQGAQPEDFAENGVAVRSQAQAADKIFRAQRLNFSFRSTEDVLSAVDEVFSSPQNYKGLSAENTHPVHSAIRIHDQGYVDIWPAELGESQQDPEIWTKTQDKGDSSFHRLAQNITKHIASWLKNNEFLPGKNRPIETGDIMILVRKRGDFVNALARALKNNNIPVAGADRLHLTDHIAIRDLIALGNFVLQPRDDLSLAALLKSPLFNISEDILLALAAKPNRKGTLLAALEKAVYQETMPQEQAVLASALERLYSYRDFADIKPVYEFYQKVLAEDGGRRQFLNRLGNEASDILDAFLDYCLSAQENGLPGLQAFLQDLSQNSPEIKRELDQNRNEVRIMTVHAAKGLEAPIVFLVDDGSEIISSKNLPKLLNMPLPPAYKEQNNFTNSIKFWFPKADYKNQITDKILDKYKLSRQEEYRRLLYVGMTRAEDRLIICGFCKSKYHSDTWLPTVTQALTAEAETITYPETGAQTLRYWHKKQSASFNTDGKTTQSTQTKPTPLPAFLTQKPDTEAGLPRPLTPSGASSVIETEPEIDPDIMLNSPILPETETAEPTASIDNSTQYAPTTKQTGSFNANESFFGAIEKGLLIHSLLQYLPEIPKKTQKHLAKAYLEKRLENKDTALKQNILATVFNILEDKRFAHLFTADSRAETALMGLITVKGQKRIVSGQIDRLAVYADKVIFADYKTGYVPNNFDEIPLEYKMQMALYAALLSSLYPDKKIQALLIYTSKGVVFTFEMPDLLPILS